MKEKKKWVSHSELLFKRHLLRRRGWRQVRRTNVDKPSTDWTKIGAAIELAQAPASGDYIVEGGVGVIWDHKEEPLIKKSG